MKGHISPWRLSRYLGVRHTTVLRLYEQITGAPLAHITPHYTDDRPRKSTRLFHAPIPREVARTIIAMVRAKAGTKPTNNAP